MPESTDANAAQYQDFSREAWARLAGSSPLPLTEAELQALRGINERISLGEVGDVYLPLSVLLNRLATARLSQCARAERGTAAPPPSGAPDCPPPPGGGGKDPDQTSSTGPFIIGMAGSVAAGKSTTARVLQALLARWPEHPQVALVTTDGFLYPNAVLEARGIMHRKGFPESYDTRRLLRFVADVRNGLPASAPVYSHATYDIVPDQDLRIEAPDILLIEGLNVFQGEGSSTPHRTFVSDLFDVSIYVDAGEEDLETWYIARFLRLRDTAFQDPHSYFHHYAGLNLEQAIATARRIWREINLVNLQQNIEPTRVRADLILEKGPQHSIQRVRLKQALAARLSS